MKNQANVPCCVCDSSDSHELFATEYPKFNYPGQFHIRKCNCCGLLFNSPRLLDEDFSDLYQGRYYFHKRKNRDEFARIINMYLRSVVLIGDDIKNKEVLEIGSAKGYLLAVMKRLGWKVQGLDISGIAADFANKKLNVPTYHGQLGDYVKKTCSRNKTFPLVLAIDILEHVLYPEQFVEDVSKIVSPDGILIIDTPNGNSANIDSQGSTWEGFNPYHIFFFSIDNLTRLFGKHGFTVEKSFSYNNYGIKPDQHKHGASITKPSGFKVKYAVKQMLKKAGLFNRGVSAYHFYENLIDSLLSTHISKACRKIKDGKTYFQTLDSKELYAEQCRGVNLVVIFRKNNCH